MEFFEKSPRETYLVISLVEKLRATKDAPILKRLLVYHRKGIQRLVWHTGIKYYLLGGGRSLKITADLLAHSLKGHPAIRSDCHAYIYTALHAPLALGMAAHSFVDYVLRFLRN